MILHHYSQLIGLISACTVLFKPLQNNCDNVMAGVVCNAAHCSWVTSNNWMPALLNVQERWRPATMQCCPQAKPSDLTLTRSGDKFSVCVRVWEHQWVSVCVPACLFGHRSSHPVWQTHNRGALFSVTAPNSGPRPARPGRPENTLIHGIMSQ